MTTAAHRHAALAAIAILLALTSRASAQAEEEDEGLELDLPPGVTLPIVVQPTPGEPGATEPGTSPASTLSPAEVEELRALYDRSSPEQRTHLKTYYSSLGVNLDQVLGISAQQAALAQRTAAILEQFRNVQFDRSPTQILAARAAIATARSVPDANGAEPHVVVQRIHQLVTAGEWAELKALLHALPEQIAAPVYAKVLTALATKDPGMLPEEVLDLADAAPPKEIDKSIEPLARVLATCVIRHGVETLLSRLRAGNDHFGPKDETTRRHAVDLLANAGLIVESYEFLPPLEWAREKKDAALVLLHAQYLERLAARSPDDLEIQRYQRTAWPLMCEAAAMPSASKPIRRKALEAALRLMAKLPASTVRPWIETVFADPELGPTAVELMAMIAVTLNDRKLDAGDRAASLVSLKEAVDVLLAHRALDPAAHGVPLRLLTASVVREIEGRTEAKPRPEYDYEYYDYYDRQPARDTQLLLRAIPSEAWLDVIDTSLATRASKASIKLQLDAGETDRALEMLASAVKRSRSDARSIADYFMDTWVTALEQRQQRRFYWSYNPATGTSTRQSMDPPVTRGYQRRNLDRLHQLIDSVKLADVDARTLPSLVRVFKACYSATELYSQADIARVFGPIDAMPASSAAMLADVLRANLKGFLRGRQDAAAALAGPGPGGKSPQPTDAELIRMMEDGYDVALSLMDRALAVEPDSWKHASARTLLAYDRVRFQQQQKKIESGTATAAIRTLFESFERSADTYARALAAGAEREQVQAYRAWFMAAVGASEFAFLRTEDLPTEGSLQEAQLKKINAALSRLSPDAAFRHRAELARFITDALGGAPPEVKPRLVRASLEVLGDHPGAVSLRQMDELYRDLIKDELKLRLTVDGPDAVQPGKPFGVMLSLRYTNAVDRETGGFSKYLQNDQWVYSADGERQVHYKDLLHRAIETAFEKSFTVDSVGFFDPFVPARGVVEAGQEGWLEKPLAYIIARPKDPSVDRLPQVTMDMTFNDQTGEVTLVSESNTPPIAVAGAAPARPLRDLVVKQTVDARELARKDGDNTLRLELSIRGRGALPDLNDALATTDFDGFATPEIEANPILFISEKDLTASLPPGERRAYPAADDSGIFRIMAERNYTLTYRPVGSLPPAAALPALTPGLNATLEARRYADMQVLPIEGGTVPLPGSTDRTAPLLLALGGLFFLLTAAWVIVRARRKPIAAAVTAVELPARITPLSAVTTLRDLRVRYESRLTPEQHAHLAEQIVVLESRYFGPNGQGHNAIDQDLSKLLNEWARTVAASSPLHS